jgi:hypothetical protein
MLSGRGLCDGSIPRPEQSYRLWCVSECDQVQINDLDTYCGSAEEARTTMRYEKEISYVKTVGDRDQTKFTFRYDALQSKPPT